MLLEESGYAVSDASCVQEALQKINEDMYDLILTDLRIDDAGDMGGLTILKAAKQVDPAMEVIVLTGYGTVESAVEAMKLVIVRVERGLARRQMTEEIGRLRERLRKETRFGATIVAESNEMKQVLHFVTKVAQSNSPVMIEGESGTGKELVARAIHSNGRPNGRFVPINCSALPETLLESELFGYMRGSFTGATINRKGMFEEAHNGTLFLDEIGDMSPALQVKLLRALDSGEIRRLGSNTPVVVDARIVTATNKDVRALVAENKFREELFYRLNVISIYVPPLRERRVDILPLAEHFLKLHSAKTNKAVVRISQEARQALVRYDWPGNVRELENAIERAVVLAHHDTISLDDLPFGKQAQQNEIIRQAVGNRWSLKRLEKEYILTILDECSGNHSQAAERLGIARNTLWRKLKDYGVS